MDKKILIATNMFAKEQPISIIDMTTGQKQFVATTTIDNLAEDALKIVTEYGIHDILLTGGPDVFLNEYRGEIYDFAHCLTYSHKPIKVILEGEL